MSDLSSENLISLAQAAKLLPSRRDGKRVHVSCLYRWTNEGCRGIRLEYLQIGSTRCTSREALGRFFDALTSQSEAKQSVPTPRPNRHTTARRKQIEAAERKLMVAGCRTKQGK
jgi:hypothetical protein